MLTQKMVKELLLIKANTSTQENLEALQESTELFSRTLAGLKKGDQEMGLVRYDSPRVRRQIARVERLWQEFRTDIDRVLATGKVTDKQVDTIVSLNMPLLKASNKLVVQYEKSSQTERSGSFSNATAINLAGRQRMLTQKMSKEFLLIFLNKDTEHNTLNLLETSTLFQQTLDGLLNGHEILGLAAVVDQPQREQLQRVLNAWNQMQAVIEPIFLGDISQSHLKVTQEQLEAVASLNLPLLREMNAAVQLFEQSNT